MSRRLPTRRSTSSPPTSSPSRSARTISKTRAPDIRPSQASSRRPLTHCILLHAAQWRIHKTKNNKTKRQTNPSNKNETIQNPGHRILARWKTIITLLTIIKITASRRCLHAHHKSEERSHGTAPLPRIYRTAWSGSSTSKKGSTCPRTGRLRR